MSTPILLACLWVLAATAIAFLPIRRQILPGFFLLGSALALLVWIARSVGPWPALAALVAVISMFRRPLMALGRHLGARLRRNREGQS